jgi:hypothetical protein
MRPTTITQPDRWEQGGAPQLVDLHTPAGGDLSKEWQFDPLATAAGARHRHGPSFTIFGKEHQVTGGTFDIAFKVDID